MPRKNSKARTPNNAENVTPIRPPASADSVSETAADKVRLALGQKPGLTTAELALVAGVGKSTAGKILSAFTKDGSVGSRRDGGPRAATRWYPVDFQSSDAGEPAAGVVDAETPDPEPQGTAIGGAAEPEPAAKAAAAPPPSKQQRLRKGELRGLVLTELRKDPDQPLTPGGIAKRLNRSSGAVANALLTLCNQGTAMRVGDHPLTYVAATAAAGDTEGTSSEVG